MRKIKIIRSVSLFLLVSLFLFLFSGSIFLAQNINLNSIKYYFSDINSTLCTIKCLGPGFLMPFSLENIKFFTLSLSLFSFAYSLTKTVERIQKTRKFVREIKKEAKPFSRFGLEINSFSHKLPLAFTAGFLKPEIFISSSLLDSLNERELKGILFHEIHHKKNYDPLKDLFISFISDSLFFIPIAKFLKNIDKLCTEIIADMNSISKGLTREEMALAFLKVCKIRKMEGSWFFNKPLERARFLLGEGMRIFPSFKKLILSIVLLILLSGIIFSPINIESRKSILHHRNVCSYHMY